MEYLVKENRTRSPRECILRRLKRGDQSMDIIVLPAAVQLAVRLCLNMAKRRKSERAPLARQKHIKKPYLVLNMI